MKLIFILLVLVFVTPCVQAQAASPATDVDLKELVATVTKGGKSNEEKTRKLVKWVNTNFTWTWTDYRKRTVEEIVARRAGNCAELANVLAALLTHGNIRHRWISEINIQVRKEDRQKSALERIAAAGNSSSVFGLMHNDHVWLEILEEKTNAWFPADPAVGVVGMKEWIAARMAFKNRLISPIPDIARIVEEMWVPFLVVAKETRRSKPTEDRTRFYIVDGFNTAYKGKLAKLPSWNAWRSEVESISPYGMKAFAGEANFHERQAEIEKVWETYQKLRQEAASLK